MRQIRLAVILFFVVSCACYSVYTIKDKLTEDRNPPVISFEEDVLVIGDEVTDDTLLEGVTATDEEDGDLTDQVQVASVSRILSDETRTIKYIVFDSANQLGTAERTLKYENYVPPRIYLKEPLRFTVSDYAEEMGDLAIKATDLLDGDITSNIRTSYTDSMYDIKAGKYEVTFQVNSSAGDTCIVTMNMVLVDNVDEAGKYYPVLKDYIAYTTVGKELKLSSYLKGIESSDETYIFGEEGTPANITASNVTIKSKVDYDTPGTYTVDYSYTTRDKVKATTTLYVVVEE